MPCSNYIKKIICCVSQSQCRTWPIWYKRFLVVSSLNKLRLSASPKKPHRIALAFLFNLKCFQSKTCLAPLFPQEQANPSDPWGSLSYFYQCNKGIQWLWILIKLQSICICTVIVHLKLYLKLSTISIFWLVGLIERSFNDALSWSSAKEPGLNCILNY